VDNNREALRDNRRELSEWDHGLSSDKDHHAYYYDEMVMYDVAVVHEKNRVGYGW
jgi:hypothetical protein